MEEYRGERILITGGYGFIGSHLVENLVLNYGVKLRLPVRDPRHVAHVAKFDVEMIQADLEDERQVESLVQGCRAIIHCAYDFRPTVKSSVEINSRITRNLLNSSKANGARFVHLSTVDVYGPVSGDILHEKTPMSPLKGDPYSQGKYAVEMLVRDHFERHQTDAVILQPSIVYGPFCRPWTINPAKQLKKSRLLLVSRGAGACNTVYVSDVVQAIQMACTKSVAGESFLISGPDVVTWFDFYSAFERALGVESSLLGVSLDELREMRKTQLLGVSFHKSMEFLKDPYVIEKLKEIPLVVFLHGKILAILPNLILNQIRKIVDRPPSKDTSSVPKDTRPIIVPDVRRSVLYASKAKIDISRARQHLGYNPSIDFENGMKLTTEFLRWANLA